MRILLSNDDGVDAEGLAELARRASALGEVWVVAPDGERSACSHAFTMFRPVRVEQRSERRFAVEGTPADCVYLAIHRLLPGKPDLVISGINKGGNLGDDVHYSGTLAAAREGVLNGISSLAVSLSLEFPSSRDAPDFGVAAEFAMEVAEEMLSKSTDAPMLLNLNVPNEPRKAIRGLRATRMGRRRYHPLTEERLDPRGRTYFWLGGTHDRFCETEGSDGVALQEGYASLTPLQTEMTANPQLSELRSWALFSLPETP